MFLRVNLCYNLIVFHTVNPDNDCGSVVNQLYPADQHVLGG
jgi:hypothetical protein